MKRFFLGMCLDYVEHWTVPDALREIFQNCLDAYQSNPENEWYIDYEEETETVRVGSKKGILFTNSLLLGKTSKKGKSNQIGKFGEGYKVGTVVLLRNGCSVTVYNYGRKEIWTAKLVNSRRYNELVPAFDIQTDSIFKPIKGNDLIFEIKGISKDVWNTVVERNLFLRNDIGTTLDVEGCGRILLDEKFKGSIYVSGLYVCSKEQLNWGYDLNPSLVSLDRDRGLVDSYNLQFTLSKVLAMSGDPELMEIAISFWEGKYINIYRHYSHDAHVAVGDSLAKKFVEKYGKDAIPVDSTEEFNYLHSIGSVPVMVSEVKKDYIKSSSYYCASGTMPEISPEENLYLWYSTVAKEHLEEECYNQGLVLIKQVLTRAGYKPKEETNKE